MEKLVETNNPSPKPEETSLLAKPIPLLREPSPPVSEKLPEVSTTPIEESVVVPPSSITPPPPPQPPPEEPLKSLSPPPAPVSPKQVENDSKSETTVAIETPLEIPKPVSPILTKPSTPTTPLSKKKSRSQPKCKKRRKKIPRDAAAPKHPHTGYIRYMNERREELRQLHPTATAIDITKMIGEEWMAMEEDKKKPFLEAAEVDKERYNREIKKYKKSEAERLNKEKENEKQAEASSGKPKILPPTASKAPDEVPNFKTNPVVLLNHVSLNGVSKPGLEEQPQLNGGCSSTSVSATITTAPVPNTVIRTGEYDVPIFTEEFLEHNKTVETELRVLRKSNTDYEQQNSVLEKHVENMRNGIEKVETEGKMLKGSNEQLQFYIDKLRLKLSNAFATLSIPTQTHGANLHNIDKYMADLHSMSTSNSHGPASLNKAKDIVRKLDLQHI